MGKQDQRSLIICQGHTAHKEAELKSCRFSLSNPHRELKRPETRMRRLERGSLGAPQVWHLIRLPRGPWESLDLLPSLCGREGNQRQGTKSLKMGLPVALQGATGPLGARAMSPTPSIGCRDQAGWGRFPTHCGPQWHLLILAFG